MADPNQPAPEPFSQVIGLGYLCSDGTGVGDDRAGYTQMTPQDDRMKAFLLALTEAFDKDADLVAKYGHVEFVGDLPRGYTLWSHVPGQTTRKAKNARPIEHVYGHPSGKYFRSATHFLDHLVEILDVNWQRQQDAIKAAVDENAQNAFDGINRENALNHATGLWYFVLVPTNPLHAAGLYNHKTVLEAVRTDQDANPVVAIPCTCNFKPAAKTV